MKYAVLVSAALLTLATVSRADDPATLPSTLPATLPATVPTVEATTLPTTAPAMQAALNSPPMVNGKLLPGGYAILNTRSIFMKGRVPSPVVPAVTTTQPIITPTVRPEHKIVFIGATETDGSVSAMFEDTAAGKIITAKLNDAIASGKVTEITLDSVTYTADGKPVKILVGQALDGSEPPPITARATITDNGNGPPTTGPTAAPSGNSDTNDAANADILERMRARRRSGQ